MDDCNGSDEGRDAGLCGVLAALSELRPSGDDAALIDQVRLLEEIKSAAAAAQAAATAAFVSAQRQAQTAAGVPTARIGRGIAQQVALAKRCSPAFAQRYVGWAMILTAELPGTLSSLRTGKATEWRAMLVARETAWLSRAHRAVVDREIAPRLEHLGDRTVEAETRKLAYRLDPRGYVDRMRAAENERRVSIRPAPDTMVRLSALLPLAEGVSAEVALRRAADSLISSGDPRSRGQLMADLLVQRVTGQSVAADVAAEVHLVMTDQTLLRAGTGADEPAVLLGYGPIPADIARDSVHRPSERIPRWIRRLYIRPDTGQLAATESRRRLFLPAQRRFVELRDQSCRTLWCDAPIRHVDHVRPHARGGPTAVENAAGLCQACNHAKQAPGWSARARPDGQIDILTPTGHRYRSRAPDPPRRPPPVQALLEGIVVDFRFAHAA